MNIHKVTHLSTVHSRYDTRIFAKMCSSLATHGHNVSLVVADNLGDEIKNGVSIIDVGAKSSGRFFRMTTSVKKVFEKAKELDSDIYHFHDPELIPTGLKLKNLGKKVIFDIHENTDLQILEKDWIPLIFRKLTSYIYRKYEDYVCKKYDCVLIGGETAEMPDLYKKNDFDLAGFGVGIIEEKEIITGKKIKHGDMVIGLKSSGFHSNGYSLIRKVIKEQNISLNDKPPFETKDKNLAVTLLRPTRLYYNLITKLIKFINVKGIAHITGGGLIGNLPRIIPKKMSIKLNLINFPKDNLFTWFKKISKLSDHEMLSTFNCGIGMSFIISKKDLKKTEKFFKNKKEKFFIIGQIVKGLKSEERCIIS